MRARHIEQGRGEDIIAHEHRHFVVVGGVHGSLSAPLRTLVHDIVVHERCRVQEFKTHGSILCHRAYLPEIFCHQQCQHRAHALASTLADVFERIAQHPVLVRQRSVEKVDEIGKVCLDRCLYD